MKRLSTKEIEEQLSRQRIVRVPDAATFWSDFRARASLRNQERPVVTPVTSYLRGWAMATACAVLLAVCGGLLLFRQTPGREAADPMTLDVEVAHSAVLMIEDETGQGTIVWIVDMETGSNDGGSA